MQGLRPNLEDEIIMGEIKDENNIINIFGIFDGHNGNSVSNYCKNNIIEELKLLYALGKDIFDNSIIENFFIDFDNKILNEEELKGRTLLLCGGSTCIMTLLKYNILEKKYIIKIINLGDSKCIIFSQNKNIIFETIDHKPNNMTELLRIRRSNGFVFNERVNGSLAVSRALGDVIFKYDRINLIPFLPENQLVTCIPEIFDFNFNQEEIQNIQILLACDGIFEKSNVKNIIDFLIIECEKNKQNEKLILTNLLEFCLENKSKDNMSAILINLKSSINTNNLDTSINQTVLLGDYYNDSCDKLSFIINLLYFFQDNIPSEIINDIINKNPKDNSLNDFEEKLKESKKIKERITN